MKVSSLALAALALQVVVPVEGFSKACMPKSRVSVIAVGPLYGYNFNNNESNDPTMDAYRRAMREMNGGLNMPDWDRKFGSTQSLRDGKLDAQYGRNNNGVNNNYYYYGGGDPNLNIEMGAGGGGGGLIPDQDDGGLGRTNSIFPPSDRATKTRETPNGQRIFNDMGGGLPPPPQQEIFYPPPSAGVVNGRAAGLPGPPGRGMAPPPPPPPRPGTALNRRRNKDTNSDNNNIFGQAVETLGKKPRDAIYPRSLPQSNAQYVPTLDVNNIEDRRRRNGIPEGGNRFSRDLYGVGINTPRDDRMRPRNGSINRPPPGGDMRRNGINRPPPGDIRRNNIITVEPENFTSSSNNYLDNLNNRPNNINNFSSRNNPLQREASSATRNNIRNERNSNERMNNIGRPNQRNRSSASTINSIGRRPYESDGIPWDVKARDQERRRQDQRRGQQFGAVGSMFNRGGFGVGSRSRGPPNAFDDRGGGPPLRERDRLILEPEDNTDSRLRRDLSAGSDRYIRSDNPLNYEGYTSVSPTLGRANGMGGTRDVSVLNGNNRPRGPPYSNNSRRAANAAGLGRRPPPGGDGMRYYDDDGRSNMYGFGGQGSRGNNGGASLAAAILIGVPLALFVGPQYLDRFPALRDNLPKSVVDYSRDFNKNVEKSLRKTGFDVTLPKSNLPSAGALKDKINNKPASTSSAPKPKVTSAEIEKQLNAVKAAPAAAPKPPPAPAAAAPPPAKSALTQEDVLKQLDAIEIGYTQPQDHGTGSQQQQQQQQQQQLRQHYADAYNNHYMTGEYDYSTQQQQPTYASNDYNSGSNNAQQQGDDSTQQLQQQHHQDYGYNYQLGGDNTQQQYEDAYTRYVSAASSVDGAAQQQQEQQQQYVQGGNGVQHSSQEDAGYHNSYWSAENSQTQYQGGYDDYSMF